MVLTARMMDRGAERAGLVSRIVPTTSSWMKRWRRTVIADFSQVAVMRPRVGHPRVRERLADGVMFERRLFHALFATPTRRKAWTPS